MAPRRSLCTSSASVDWTILNKIPEENKSIINYYLDVFGSFTHALHSGWSHFSTSRQIQVAGGGGGESLSARTWRSALDWPKTEWYPSWIAMPEITHGTPHVFFFLNWNYLSFKEQLRLPIRVRFQGSSTHRVALRSWQCGWRTAVAWKQDPPQTTTNALCKNCDFRGL